MNQESPPTIESQNTLNESKEVGGLHWFHWLIISSSLVLTFFAWYFSSKQLEEKIEQQFLRQANQVVDLVTERMHKYEDALWSGVATIYSQSYGVDYEEWQRFSSVLRLEKRYPGINGIGFIYHVNPDKLDTFLERERKTRPDFTIFPKHDNNLYLPITYIEPVEINRKAVGLDVAHEANRLQAALAARDSGKATITGPIVLVQDSEKTPGFLFYAPFYSGNPEKINSIGDRQEKFVGLVYAPFIFKNLLKGTLAQSRRAVNLRIEDGGFVLYDEHSEMQTDSFYEEDFHVDMYGREWFFSVWSTQGFRDQNASNQPLIILFGGIFIDTLLFALFFLISKRNRQVVNLANVMTRQYRKKTEELEVANAELQEFSYRVSHDLRSPITSSVGLLSFARKAIDENKVPKALASLNHASNSLQQLQLLVEGILDLAKATHLDEDEVVVNVNSVLNEVINKLACMENAHRITFNNTVDNQVTLTTKKIRFQLILENLISNAIKYQDTKKQRSWIKISTIVEEGYFLLSVEDNGLGIPENMQDKLFSMFKRFHTNVSQGSGLGLYMVKKSASKLNGDILFSDGEAGVGVCFTLKIKL